MDPSKKGWLSEFITFKREHFTAQQKEKKVGQDPEHSFYGIVQPTGLMYGFPVHIHKELNAYHWSESDRVKVLLLECLISVAELYRETELADENAVEQLVLDTIKSVGEFYSHVYPEISVSATNWLGKKKDVLLLAEQVLEKRTAQIMAGDNNFWLSFFKRSQLFLDVYIFGQWSHTNPDEVLQDFFRSEKEEISYNAVKVMSAAAHANSRVEEEETSLFNLFIESSGMPSEKKRVAKEYFEHGLGIQDIPIDSSDPWIIRKFLLELAILTVWSDKKVEQEEVDFLAHFNDSLGFSEEDLNKSMIAIEGFVLENWAHLDMLQNKKDYEQVSLEYIGRVASVAAQYKNRIFNEIKQDQALLHLIKKGSASELSTEEQYTIKTKLVGILADIPVFSVIALPDSFFSYSNVIKVLPKEVIKAINDET